MTINFTKTFFTFLFCLLLSITYARTSEAIDTIGVGNSAPANLLFHEDFSHKGIPIGWTNEDVLFHNVLWKWCPGPDAIPGPSSDLCPQIWSESDNFQKPFASSTADNGFLFVDSDKAGNVSHKSQLTTLEIDTLANYSQVWVHFQTHIGAYNVDPDLNAVLKVSNDGKATWTSFTCFPNFKLGDGYRWSVNPEHIFIDISSVAADEPSIYIQWEWSGRYEYHWSIDDFEIYDADPRPANDLSVSREWFAIAPNKIIPTSQVSPFGFMADVANRGLADQSNVELKIEIFDESTTVVHSDSINLGTILAGELAENNLFTGANFLPSEEVQRYLGRYQVSADSSDFSPADNILEFRFRTSDTTFANEDRINYSVAPPASHPNWQGGVPHSWTWGNYFYIPNGSGFIASSASFSVFNLIDLKGKSAVINLYKWVDLNNDSNVQKEEREWIGYHDYTFPNSNTNQNTSFVNVPLENINGTGPIYLTNNTAYLLMLEYSANESENFFINCNRRHNYEPMIWRSIEVNQPRYGGMLGIAGSIEDVTYEPVGFGENYIPAIRLHVKDSTTSVNHLLSLDHKIKVFPNPVNQKLWVQLDFAQQLSNVQIRIMDTDGRMWEQAEFAQVQEEQVSFRTKHLGSGIYFLQVITDQGMRTQRFAVQH